MEAIFSSETSACARYRVITQKILLLKPWQLYIPRLRFKKGFWEGAPGTPKKKVPGPCMAPVQLKAPG
jgi:hypothetical protein